MKPCLVFDLRNHHFVAGVVDIKAGQLSWKPERVQIWQREGAQDVVDQADLCFFRRPHEKTWKPTSATALSQLSNEYEIIADLFDQPQDFITPCLGSLLSPILKLYEKLEILFLVDADQSGKLLTRIIQRINRSCRIIVAPDDINMLSGFALLSVAEKIKYPEEGQL